MGTRAIPPTRAMKPSCILAIATLVVGTAGAPSYVGSFLKAFPNVLGTSDCSSLTCSQNTITPGTHSTAFGFQNTASGQNSVAFGAGSKATGSNSVAFGYQATASSDN